MNLKVLLNIVVNHIFHVAAADPSLFLKQPLSSQLCPNIVYFLEISLTDNFVHKIKEENKSFNYAGKLIRERVHVRVNRIE